MRTIYNKKLKNSNIILGVHAFFKLILVLLLFVVLSKTIWIKEKYLNYVKASIYSQIFIVLIILIQIIVLNNPKFFDICEACIKYVYLICSILELALIIMELFGMIKNLNLFIIIFHDCPYYRTFNEIIDNQYQRSCLYYKNITTIENIYNYQYICYYNSEEEYYNTYCDGFFCSKSKIANEIKNINIKCNKSGNDNVLVFNEDNPYYNQEEKVFMKYDIEDLYICTRKNKVEKNNDILNGSCPDDNPLKKNISYIYVDFIMHFLLDFLFIYEFIIIIKVNKLYAKIQKELNLGNSTSQQSNANMNPNRNQDGEFTENKKTVNNENQNKDKIENNSYHQKDFTQKNIENIKNQPLKSIDKLYSVNEEDLNENESSRKVNSPPYIKELKTINKYIKIAVNSNEVEQSYPKFMESSDINVHLSSKIEKKNKYILNKEEKNTNKENNNTFFIENKEQNREKLESFLNNNNINKHPKKVIKIKTYDLILDEYSTIEKNNQNIECENETEKFNTTKSQYLFNISKKSSSQNDQSPNIVRLRNINFMSTEKKVNTNSCIKNGKTTIEEESNNININVNDSGLKNESKNLNDIRLNAKKLCNKQLNKIYENYDKNIENKYNEIKEPENKNLLSYQNLDEDKKDTIKNEEKEKNSDLKHKKVTSLTEIMKVQNELFMKENDKCDEIDKKTVNPELVTNVNNMNKNKSESGS